MAKEAAVAEPPVATVEAAQPKRETRPAPGEKPKKQPEYAVIVENDDDHTFVYVAEVLQRVCRLDTAQAWRLTSRVHQSGEAVVWTGSLEVAELKRDQIRGYGPDFYAPMEVEYPLGVRLEPMGD